MDNFWEVIAELKWDGNFKRCKQELLKKYSKPDVEEFEKFVRDLTTDLDKRFKHYAIPCGDDGWSDIRAEVVGRGQEFFENITVTKLHLMAIDTDYHESFIYIFPSAGEWVQEICKSAEDINKDIDYLFTKINWCSLVQNWTRLKSQ